MKFLCLICAERVMEQLPHEEAARHFDEYVEFTKGIRESGHYIGGNRLLPPATAVTVRVRNGRLSTTDGPFAETKEQLGGYYVIEARDLNEAIRVAARIPGARLGCVEVRPIADDEPTRRALQQGDAMKIESYLFFNGRCEEAIDFYKRALGAEVVMLMRYKDSPEPPAPGMVPPGSENKIMHASLRIGDTTVMASDGQCQGNANFDGFALTVSAGDAAEAERRFAALSDGGTVTMPLSKTFFAPSFGMLNDRFGVHWMVIAEH